MTTEQRPWQEPSAEGPLPFWSSLREDALAHSPPEGRPTAFWDAFAFHSRIALLSSGFHAVLAYRLSHWFAHRLGLVGRCLAATIHWWGRHWYACDLAPKARLYGGFILPHPLGIVIGPETVVGPRTYVFQNVAFGGGGPGRPGEPRIGSDARIYPGAVVCGPITLGDGVHVGANTVVYWSVPAGHIVRQANAVSGPLSRRALEGRTD